MAPLVDALERLCQDELDLAGELRAVGEWHAVDHDVFHLSRTLAQQCEEHVKKLVPIAQRHGAQVGEPGEPGFLAGLATEARRRASAAGGRSPQGGALLLEDLRRLYVHVQAVLIEQTIVKQGASALRDKELLDTIEPLMAETEVQGKWLKTRIKAAAPQVLAAS